MPAGWILLVLTPRWSEQNTERMDRLLQRLGIPLQSANRDRGDVSGMDAGDHEPGVIQRVGERVTIELTLGRMHAHGAPRTYSDIGMLTASRMRVHGFLVDLRSWQFLQSAVCVQSCAVQRGSWLPPAQ